MNLKMMLYFWNKRFINLASHFEFKNEDLTGIPGDHIDFHEVGEKWKCLIKFGVKQLFIIWISILMEKFN